MSDEQAPAEISSFFLYSGPDRKVPIECRVMGETIWLTQKQLAELLDVGIPAINKHLKNIFETGELEESATVSKMEIVQIEGTREVKRSVDFFNLDAPNKSGTSHAVPVKLWIPQQISPEYGIFPYRTPR